MYDARCNGQLMMCLFQSDKVQARTDCNNERAGVLQTSLKKIWRQTHSIQKYFRVKLAVGVSQAV